MPIVDHAIYVQGKRIPTPDDFRQTLEIMHAEDGVCWMGLYRPTPDEIHEVAEEFDLHELAVEDTLESHQRAKMDQYGEHTFVVLRPARYLDDVEKVEFGELHVYVGPDFVITVRQAEVPELSPVRHRMEEEVDLLTMGPPAILYAILDQVVDEYEPVADGLEKDIEEIEAELFTGNAHVSRRIYELFREVVEFQRATAPLERVVSLLRRRITGEASDSNPFLEFRERDFLRSTTTSGPVSEAETREHERIIELDRHYRDVHDHIMRINERVVQMKSLLTNALSLSSTLSSQSSAEAGVEQNEQMKKISSWAAILFAPSLIGSIYGMNFNHMPELQWVAGYPLALSLMFVLSFGLWAIFKHNKWL
ncbi:magnesium transporter [Neomicrococcus aestuarii]|uniref:Magnesium transporter n=1 Tax=Neomicrococcus aestuarii TaxID=556325 RepID=A0A7W8WYS4_9MICC|nr:magnesium and cobalt transport protein CorA [Neomicrococcus aestuarii]MBB5512631.1 magnesium transporter [Neomicrococcus aestuarii]